MDVKQLEMESLLNRDASKRKRVNRNARLKQCKLDARREQWLGKLSSTGSLSPSSVLESPSPKVGNGSSTGDSDAESCVINHDDLCDGGQSDLLCWNFQSNVSKSISCTSSREKADNTGKRKSGKKKSKSKNKTKASSDQQSLKKNGDDNATVFHEDDDWEAAADALDSQMNLNKEHKDFSETSSSSFKRETAASSRIIQRSSRSLTSTSTAWKIDDTFRPASLPRVLAPSTLPPLLPRPGTSSILPGTSVLPSLAPPPPPPPPPPAAWVTNRHRDFFARSPAASGSKGGGVVAPPVPACCPICTEELDSTDSSFLPCSCGFRLCLFCHHRIASDDGRCPGCRKAYKA